MSPLSPKDLDCLPGSLATLVHDVRQPLSNIEASTSLLRIVLGQSGDARICECLDRIDRQVEAIDRLLAACATPISPPAVP